MSYSMDTLTDGCYEGTTVLINKFGIRDGTKLNRLEAVLTASRIAEWLNCPKCDTFDFEHYKAIHRYLFSDIYDWAGTIRTADMSKGGTVFCPSADIEKRAFSIFKRLKQQDLFAALPQTEYIDEITDLYISTNELHPFREGNGRTQRVFFTQLIRSSGYDFSFENIDADLLMLATIQAAHGVSDNLRIIFLENIFEQ